jgi:endo-1,4-beta-mannosidase
MSADIFELGCNYWPRSRAMYMWRDLDLGEVREELAQIRDLGFDVVRIFTLTEDFLPGPTSVDPRKVAALVDVARAAKDAGLRVVPTMIVINMSGRAWWPEWMLAEDGRPHDLFADPTLLRAQALLVETCARALAGDTALRAIDLANEIDDALVPPSRDAGRQWATHLAEAARRGAPGVSIQIGAHLPSLSRSNNMRVDDLAAVADEDCMHAYPLYSDVARSPLDPDLVPFSCALSAALAGSGRRVLMQEFGLCTAPRGSAGRSIEDDFLGAPRQQYLASEEEAATYTREVLERLVRTGAAGAYAWCYADYDARLWDRPPLDRAIRERTFGLVRSDGSPKPAAEVFRAFAGRACGERTTAIAEQSADHYYSAPERRFRELYASFRG